jgi:uncharacterized membrane protein YGL010W
MARKTYFDKMFANYARFHNNTVNLALHTLLLPLGLISAMLVLLGVFGHTLFAAFTTVYVLCYSAMVPRYTGILSGVIVLACAFCALVCEVAFDLHVMQSISLTVVYGALQYVAHLVTHEPMFLQEYSKLPNALDHLVEQFVFRVPLLLTALYTFRADFALWFVHHRGVTRNCFTCAHDLECLAKAHELAGKLSSLKGSEKALARVRVSTLAPESSAEKLASTVTRRDQEDEQEHEQGERNKRETPQTLQGICAEFFHSLPLRAALDSVYDERMYATSHVSVLDEVIALGSCDAKDHSNTEFTWHTHGWLLQFVPLVSLHTCYLFLSRDDTGSGGGGANVVGYEDDWRGRCAPDASLVPVEQTHHFALVDQYAVPHRLEVSTTSTTKHKNKSNNDSDLILTVNILVYPACIAKLVPVLEHLVSSNWGVKGGLVATRTFEYVGVGNIVALAMAGLLVWAAGGSWAVFAAFVGCVHNLPSIASLFLSPVGRNISHYTVVRDSVMSHCLFWMAFGLLYCQAHGVADTNDVASQAFVLFGAALSLSGWYALGLVRACCGAEYGLQTRDLVSRIPFSTGIPHPIYAGELFALMGGVLLPAWRASGIANTFGLSSGALTLLAIYVEHYAVRCLD